jgi:hypothetical protein
MPQARGHTGRPWAARTGAGAAPAATANDVVEQPTWRITAPTPCRPSRQPR